MSEIWDKPITDTTDWGGDSSTGGLPVSGRQVQAWLKSRIAKILTEAQITKIIEDWVQENGFADDEGFVTLSSDQEINGLKNFLQGLMVNGGLVKYDPELKVWQLNGNLLVTGGISMYSNLDGFTPSTIMGGILTDEVTITVKDGRLTVLAAESGLNYDELDAYLKKYEYTTISEVDARISELVNGAPQAYDTLKEIADILQGNVNSIGDILATLAEKANTTYVDEAIADTKTWVEEQQYINEIDPSYIEAALGYQPYDGDTNRKEFTTKTYVKDNFVSRTLANEIEAIHNFLNGFNIAGIPFRKTANGQLFIDANVVFGGGVTMYGTDTTPAPSIFDGLPIDNETIYWDNGVLKAMGGGGGGGVADSVAWANVSGKPTWITNTKPTYNYSEIQGTPDLSVYALATAIPTNNNKLANGAGYITGITSSMVTAALGYTPLSTTGKAANAYKLGGLPPIYRKGEGCIPTITSGGVMEIGKYIDFHTVDEEEDVDYSLRIECQGAYRNRVYFPTTTGTLALTSDIPSLAGYATESWVNTALAGYLPITGGNVSGDISISGNVGIGTDSPTDKLHVVGKALITDNLAVQSFKTANIAIECDRNGGNHTMNRSQIERYGGTLYLQYHGDNVSLAAGGGNVAIGGTTANAKLHVYGGLLTESQSGWSGTFKGGAKSAVYAAHSDGCGLSVMSTAATTDNIYLFRVWQGSLTGTSGTGVAVLDVKANGTIQTSGNLVVGGGITMYSQRSLKNILSYDGLSLEQLSVIKPIKFTWRDGRDNRYHVGGVADDIATVVPEVVYSANDFLTMDYGNAGFYVAASLIKPVIHCYNKVEKHEKDIDYLKRENVAIKKENKALRDEINQLKQAS